MENTIEKTSVNNYDNNIFDKKEKNSIYLHFNCMWITLKALTEINLASGHTKEDKNKENLIILTKKSFVEVFYLNYCIADQSLWDGVGSTNGNHSINKVDNLKKITLLY